MQTDRSWFYGIIVCLWVLFPSQTTAAEAEAVPSDFSLVAEFGAGFSTWKSWMATISSDGSVLQKVYDFEDGETETAAALTRSDLIDLFTEMKAVEFFSIPEDFSYPVTDNETLVLAITADGQSHRVRVYAPGHQRDNGGVKRFLRVWDQVLRKVPSPNSRQAPGMYSP